MKLRRTQISIIVIGLFLILVFTGAALAAIGPAQPGQLFFPFQQSFENFQLLLTRQPDSRLELLLKLAERRQDDLSQRAGTTYEPLAARYLVSFLTQAGEVIPALEGEQKLAASERLLQLSQEVKTDLANLPLLPSRYRTVYYNLQAQLTELTGSLDQETAASGEPAAPAAPVSLPAAASPAPAHPAINARSLMAAGSASAG
mgnify:CR=1 FL=1